MILEKATERSAGSTGNAEVGRLSMGGQRHLTGIAAGRRASEKKLECGGIDGKSIVIKSRCSRKRKWVGKRSAGKQMKEQSQAKEMKRKG
jgi:hypothetical protein